MPSGTSAAVVIGAGPAGLATVAVLLDLFIQPIIWVDPQFNGGRLASYSEVPSNTKVDLFMQYMQRSDCLWQLCSLEDSPLKHLRQLDPNEGCQLKYAQQMVHLATNRLAESHSDKLQLIKGHAEEIHLLSSQKSALGEEHCWKVSIASPNLVQEVVTKYLFLATGSEPKELSLPASTTQSQLISLDVALSPSLLEKAVSEDDVVAVVGSSHSAVLVLKNLTELPNSPRIIKNYFKSPLKYAEYKEGWILYDNTGLKGVAADWARKNLEQPSSTKIQRITMNSSFEEYAAADSSISDCTKIIYAVGYQRSQLPPIINSKNERVCSISHNNENGKIYLDQEEAPNLFGFGIAFPQKIVDLYGNVEDNVGMFKFMKYIKCTLNSHLKPAIASSS